MLQVFGINRKLDRKMEVYIFNPGKRVIVYKWKLTTENREKNAMPHFHNDFEMKQNMKKKEQKSDKQQ